MIRVYRLLEKKLEKFTNLISKLFNDKRLLFFLLLVLITVITYKSYAVLLTLWGCYALSQIIQLLIEKDTRFLEIFLTLSLFIITITFYWLVSLDLGLLASLLIVFFFIVWIIKDIYIEI